MQVKYQGFVVHFDLLHFENLKFPGKGKQIKETLFEINVHSSPTKKRVQKHKLKYFNFQNYMYEFHCLCCLREKRIQSFGDGFCSH